MRNSKGSIQGLSIPKSVISLETEVHHAWSDLCCHQQSYKYTGLYLPSSFKKDATKANTEALKEY